MKVHSINTLVVISSKEKQPYFEIVLDLQMRTINIKNLCGPNKMIFLIDKSDHVLFLLKNL